MKFLDKIGREVCYLKSTKTNQRNGEGDFVRLKDGSIMHAYSAYFGSYEEDHSSANICAIYSYDEGETWTEPTLLIKKSEDDRNIMCVSFLRMQNGDLGIFYGRNYKKPNDYRDYSDVLFRRSTDEGKTWSDAVKCHNITEDFVCFENGRVIRTKTGRIIVPINLHSYKKPGRWGYIVGESCFFASDDDGKTFHQIGEFYPNPIKNCKCGLQENGVIELENGRLFSYNRTAYGSQFESFSDDDGETWTEPRPSYTFYSPLAPMNTKHIGDKYTVAVHCPYPGRLDKMFARSPLICNIVKGKGEDFFEVLLSKFYLEDDLETSCCYPSIFDGGDYFLVAYYYAKGYPDKCYPFGDMKITKVEFKEFEKIVDEIYEKEYDYLKK